MIEEIKQLQTKNECLQEKNNILLEENKLLKLQRFSFENLCENKEQFRSATGINPDCFMRLFNYLSPGDDCSNVKSGPKPKISAKEQLLMYLSWLKNGFFLSHVSFLFQTTKATISRYIITWTNFLYFPFGLIPIWPTREQFNKEIPVIFKRTYLSTRCILDCTEPYCQRPSSLSTQCSLYSHYKSHVTYEGLIGVSPSGSIMFVSELYDSSI